MPADCAGEHRSAWYQVDTIDRMAMTLRLTEEQDKALTELAAAQGVSKGEAAARAIMEAAERDLRAASIETALDDVLRRYPKTIERLGQ